MPSGLKFTVSFQGLTKPSSEDEDEAEKEDSDAEEEEEDTSPTEKPAGGRQSPVSHSSVLGAFIKYGLCVNLQRHVFPETQRDERVRAQRRAAKCWRSVWSRLGLNKRREEVKYF